VLASFRVPFLVNLVFGEPSWLFRRAGPSGICCNSLGFITGRSLPRGGPSAINYERGPRNTEPGQKLLDCYTLLEPMQKGRLPTS